MHKLGCCVEKKQTKKKTEKLSPYRTIFWNRMWCCSIVIFPCGAYIYILLHGFRIKLKLSSRVRAFGEHNLLWHSPAAEDWIISRARLPACTFTLGDVPQSTFITLNKGRVRRTPVRVCTPTLSRTLLFICKHCRYVRITLRAASAPPLCRRWGSYRFTSGGESRGRGGTINRATLLLKCVALISSLIPHGTERSR